MVVPDIPPDELGDIYTFAVQLAKDAGSILLQSLERRRVGTERSSEFDQVEKLNSVDIVTQTDLEVEAFIKTTLCKKYKSHAFVGEESYSKRSSSTYIVTDSPTWVVDPLDGTVNFTHGFPMFCVSIALVVNQNPVIGVIYAPMLGQLFSACNGKGAWLNQETRLPLLSLPLPADAPNRCIFACEWGKDRENNPTGNLHRKSRSYLNLAAESGPMNSKGGMVHGMRMLGSASLDLAYTAMGSIDIWWDGGCWEWDIAAGVCILKEAGGLFTTANPPPDFELAKIPEAHIGSMLYLAVRSVGSTATTGGRESQERTVREVWRRVESLDFSRIGI